MKRFLVALFVVALLGVGAAVAAADGGIHQPGIFGDLMVMQTQQLQNNFELVASVTDTIVAAEWADVSNPIDVDTMAGIQTEVQRPQTPITNAGKQRLQGIQTDPKYAVLSSRSSLEDPAFPRERSRWAVSV